VDAAPAAFIAVAGPVAAQQLAAVPGQ
jgi:hypothetical protein